MTGLVLCVLPGFSSFLQAKNSVTPSNVLLIIVDDLRPELGCYGHPHIQSPYIDRWASESVVFHQAYCNIAVSGASRGSLLTGRRPTMEKLRLWNARIDADVPEAVTMQQHFKEAGFTTISNGKVTHHQDEASLKYWDEIMPPVSLTPMDYHSKENLELMRRQKETGKGKRGYFYEYGNFPDSIYLDWQITQKSITDLNRLKEEHKPFFMAVGFIRPHLPFNTPDKYWNMYDHNQIQLPDNYILKEGNKIPAEALTNWSELRAYSGIPDKGALDEETAKNMIHGYYASVSFIDAQIGRLLNVIKETGLDKNTTIALIGDHGWNLGEHGTWCKHSIMNTCLHSTLIIQSPEGKNYRNNEIVEFVDIYPTLCEAAGIDRPKELEGESLYPLLLSEKAKSKGWAVSRWAEGFTYIEDQYFYTEWWDEKDNLKNRMLFDHHKDQDENYNVAENERYKNVVEAYSEMLHQRRWKRIH